MGLIDRFVCRYIRRNFHHGVVDKRNMILRAVTDSMRETFNEDNLVTRYHSLITWILENDEEFNRIIAHDPQSFRQALTEVLKEAVLEKE